VTQDGCADGISDSREIPVSFQLGAALGRPVAVGGGVSAMFVGEAEGLAKLGLEEGSIGTTVFGASVS
jgi:hypothetical protein